MAIQRLKILALCSWYPNDFNPTLGNFVKKHAEAASLYNDVVSLSVFHQAWMKKYVWLRQGQEHSMRL